MSHKNLEIERLRGIALLMVLINHLGHTRVAGFFPDFMTHGWSGVELFFVISGFVIAKTYLDTLPLSTEWRASLAAFKAFYLRRAFRILPVALLGLLLPMAYAAIAREAWILKEMWSECTYLLLGVYNYVSIPKENFPIYWSLTVEEHFYLLFPTAMILVRSRERRIQLLLTVIAVTALVLRPRYYNLDTRLLSHLAFDYFALGVLLFLLGTSRQWRTKFPWNLLSYLGVATIWLIPPALRTSALYPMTILLASGLVVGIAGQSLGVTLTAPGLRQGLEYLGSRSYVLYVAHLFLWKTIDAKISTPSRGWRLLLLTAALLVVAEVIHRWVEMPLNHLGKRLSDRLLRLSYGERPTSQKRVDG